MTQLNLDLINKWPVFGWPLSSTSLTPLYAVNSFDPDFVLDFKNSYYRKGGSNSTLSGSVTHARASSATMTNSSGTLVTVGNNVPRVGHHVYNGSAWVNEGVLHESEARTNLVTYSNDFTDVSWTQNVTITPNDAVSPDGTSNASHLSFPSSGYLFISSNSRTVGQKYTVSAWVKSYDGTDEAFQLYGENGAFKQNFIATSEWQRFSFTYTATTSTGSVGGIARPTTNIPASLHAYGIQIEAGATPSSYIATSGSTATRAAETLTISAANLPYSSTNMSIQMDGKMTFADEDVSGQLKFFRWFKDNNNEIRVLYDTHSSYGTGRITFQQIQGGNFRIVNSGSNIYPEGLSVPFNIASRHGSSFVNGAISGTALTVITTPVALPDLSTSTLSLGNTFMGTIAQFRMWDEDLTDTGIAEAST